MSSATVKLINDNFCSPSTVVTNKSLDKSLKFLKNYITTPVCTLSAVSGALSYFLPNHFDSESELTETIATYSSKFALLTNAVYGGIENLYNKEASGTVGYVADFLVSLISSPENMYTLRGIGSALDQLPLFNQKIGKHKEIQNIYNPDKNNNFDFVKYNGFSDSTESTVTGIKVVASDFVNDFKEKYKNKGLLQALVTPFQKAEKNLLISSIGIMTGVVSSLIPGINLFGATVRDVFGIHADLAVIHGGVSQLKEQKKGGLQYVISGAFYILGSALDLIYRWTEKQNMNLFAIGTDRLGAFFMALANGIQNDQTRNSSISLPSSC